MTNLRSAVLTGVASLILATGAQAADQLLSGTITSASGQKLEGVTVSARQEGSTITTSVYTDGSGGYYFSALPAGTYTVWAQALGFEVSRGAVDLSAARRHDLVLHPIADAERRIRQLPSELLVAALPEATEEDARMKRVFQNECTGCHSGGYALQFRFDQAGWSKIITAMKLQLSGGVAEAKIAGILDHNQSALSAYLAKARGPGDSTMKFVARSRPAGEAARAVWKLYDIPRNPDAGSGTKFNTNDGTDWALGTTSKIGELAHDAGMGLDGTVYFTVNQANVLATIGRVDTRTGAVTYMKVDGENGRAAPAHGLARDAQGNFWFDVNPGRRALGKLDTSTQKITVYQTPKDMVPLGGAVTMDVDGKGKIWASAADGAIRFDPVTEKFIAFKSLTPHPNAKGSGMTYGAAGDRDGNGWWAQMAIDTIGHADVATGKVTEVKLPPVKAEMDRLTAEERAFYEAFDALGFNDSLPWAEGPRRMGTDKNGDVLWVGNSWGASLARIDTKTSEATIVPFPDRTMQPYHVAVDRSHNVWGDMWSSDQIYRFDPSTKSMTTFDLPVRGTESRHISVLERDGRLNVTIPIPRSSQMGVLTIRTEAELAALKAQAR